MANLQGYTSGAVGNMLNHYTRHDGDPQQDKYRYQNQKIDTSRTYLNYALFEREDPQAFIRQRVAEAETKPGKKTNVISDWIVTLPKNEQLDGREREFFEQAYEFLKEKVGAQNIVGAWVHNDETSPHMHFCFTPVCEQVVMTNDKGQPLRWTERDETKNPAHKAGEVKRDGKGTVRYRRVAVTDDTGNPVTKKTVSQSKMFDRRAMQDFHPQLTAHMQKHFGFDVGVELEDEGDRVLSRLEHGEYIAAKTTLKKTKAQVERMTDKREEIRKLGKAELDELRSLHRERKAAQERVEALEAVAAECGAADNAPVSSKGALFGRVVNLCARCIQRLGLAMQTAKETAKKQLTISVRNGADADTGLHGRQTAAEVIMPAIWTQAQRDTQMEFTL